MGFCLRGQGLFSHSGLPLAAETVEYAWLLELHVGRITGHLTAPQLSVIVHVLNEFLFTMVDPENQLICSRDFELCQHAKPQVIKDGSLLFLLFYRLCTSICFFYHIRGLHSEIFRIAAF